MKCAIDALQISYLAPFWFAEPQVISIGKAHVETVLKGR